MSKICYIILMSTGQKGVFMSDKNIKPSNNKFSEQRAETVPNKKPPAPQHPAINKDKDKN